MNYYLSTQIDENGNETGEVKLIHGSEETVRCILKDEKSQERRKDVGDSIKKMSPGDFDTITSGKFIYELDCLSQEDVDKMSFEKEDLIDYESSAVFEIYYENKDLKYAFGREDLNAKLKECGFNDEEIKNFEVEEGKEAFLETTDPVHVSVTVKKLSDLEVEKKISTDEKFALDFETMLKAPANLNENSDDGWDEVVSSYDNDNFKITIYKTQNDKYYYIVSKDGKFCKHVSFFNSLDDAMTHSNDHYSSEVLTESKEFNHCNCNIKIMNEDGKICSDIDGRKFKNLKSSEEAEKFSKFIAESGIGDEGKVYEITFSLSGGIARKANEAIDDNPYLRHNTEWSSSNVLVITCEDEDDSLLDEVKEQLESWGIPEDEYDIEEVES